MFAMFYGCTNLNQDLTNFDTSNVTNMGLMFAYSTNFNGNVSNFNTSSVENMYAMFYSCTNFNQDISNFNIESVTNIESMLQGATSWSTTNYDLFLISLSAQTLTLGLVFHCSSYYTLGGSAETARNDLVNNDLWTISDLGGV